jgi:4-amino-4-deoxy-L-arabinose transferase-like glycosyltransferase
VFWCFAVFVLLRAVPVFFLPLEMDSDAGWYLGRGLDLAAGKGYSEGGHLTAYWPVGYPGFLGALFYIFGKQAIVGQVANLVLAGASFFLVLGLGRQIFRSESTARVSALLLALYPNNVAYTPLLLTEIYFTFLLLLAVYIYITKSSTLWVLLAGLVFGLAALTKPQVLFLPGLLALLPLLSREGRASTRRHIINGMMLYAAMAVILVPWALRNTLVFGETVLISTNGGATLLTGNNPSADGGYVPDDPLVAQRNFTVQDQVAADRRAKALAMQWITENPRRFLELVPLKIWHLWYKDGEAEWAYQSGYAQYERYRYLFRSARALNQAYYALLILAFVASLVLLRKSHRSLAWPWVVFGYIYVVYLTLISIVFSGQPRLHFPAMPWIIMYAAWAMTVLPQITSRGTSRSVAA